MHETSVLADYNEAGVRRLAAAVGLDAGKFTRASTLNVSGTATELLIAITHKLGGDSYLAGGGAAGYQEDEKFAAAGVRLRYQAFEHPTYSQLADGTHPGLSIVDALMHCGADATAPTAGVPFRTIRKREMDIRGKKLVVIGGAGLIGSHTIDALTREDVGEIIVYDNFVRGSSENLRTP